MLLVHARGVVHVGVDLRFATKTRRNKQGASESRVFHVGGARYKTQHQLLLVTSILSLAGAHLANVVKVPVAHSFLLVEFFVLYGKDGKGSTKQTNKKEAEKVKRETPR